MGAYIFKDKHDIESFRRLLLKNETTGKRNVVAFNTTLLTGARAGDILNLKIEQVDGRESVDIFEGKTGKKRNLFIKNTGIQDYIDELKAKGRTEGYIFTSLDRKNKYKKAKTPPQLTTHNLGRAYKVATKGSDFEKYSITTHTARRTFGYHFYKQTKNIAHLQNIYNHSSQALTLKYIGITDEEINDNLKDFIL